MLLRVWLEKCWLRRFLQFNQLTFNLKIQLGISCIGEPFFVSDQCASLFYHLQWSTVLGLPAYCLLASQFKYIYHKVGVSFMNSQVDECGTLEEHWSHSIMPELFPSNGYSAAHLSSCWRGKKC